MLMQERPDVFWSMIISMYFGNIILLVLNLPLIPLFCQSAGTPKSILTVDDPVLQFDWGYLVSFNTFDLF